MKDEIVVEEMEWPAEVKQEIEDLSAEIKPEIQDLECSEVQSEHLFTEIKPEIEVIDLESFPVQSDHLFPVQSDHLFPVRTSGFNQCTLFEIDPRK